jgi:hypothetical protein
MKRWVALVLSVMFVAGCASGEQMPRPGNLRGTWQWDNAKSDPLRRFGKEVLDADVTLIIEHQEPVLNIQRVVSSPQGGQTRRLHYSMDGQENANLSVRGTEVRTRSRWDHGKLITEGRRTVDSPMGKVTLSSTEIWTLSPDGRTLTIDAKTAAPGGLEIKHKEVFQRKE